MSYGFQINSSLAQIWMSFVLFGEGGGNVKLLNKFDKWTHNLIQFFLYWFYSCIEV